MILFKLALENILKEKVRSFTALLGVAASCGLLAWHLGLTDTISSQSGEAVKKATEPYSVWVNGFVGGRRGAAEEKTEEGELLPTAGQALGFRRSGRGFVQPIPQDVIDTISSSEVVKNTLSLDVLSVTPDIRPGGHIVQGPPMIAKVAIVPESGVIPFYSATNIIGRLPTRDCKELEACVSYYVYEQRNIAIPELGEMLDIATSEGVVSFKIVGFFRHDNYIEEFPTMYIPESAFSALDKRKKNQSSGVASNLLLCELAEGYTEKDFHKLINEIAEVKSKCTYSSRSAVADRFQTDTVSNMKKQLPLSLSLAILTAICMLVSVMTISVAEQRRRIAMLRCVGMTRKEVFVIMLYESLILGVLGWILGVIVSLGFLQIFLAVENSPELPETISVSLTTILSTLTMVLLISLISCIFPSRKAMKVAPLEAIENKKTLVNRVSKKKTIAGIVLLLPMLVMGLPLSSDGNMLRKILIVIGLPSFIAGSVLCIPFLMKLVERCFGGIISRIVRVDEKIISERLNKAPERAIGTIVTLSMGLCSFIAIHIWGGTLMSSYIPSKEWPDVIVSALPNGLAKDQVRTELDKSKVGAGLLPIECTQFPLDKKCLDEVETRGGNGSGQVLIFGANPEKSFFDGENTLARFRFTKGNARDAVVAMNERAAGVVPEMFVRLTKLGLGDTVTIAGVDIEIVGVVDLNWHLVTSRSLVRTLFGRLDKQANHGRGGDTRLDKGSPKENSGGQAMDPAMRRTMGMIFVSEDLARKLTGNADRVNFLWANLGEEYRNIHPLQATVRLDAYLRDKLQIGSDVVLRVHHRDEIADGTLSHGNDIIGTMARIPFWSLLVTSTGIAVLLIAGAGADRKMLLMMRSIGMTRGQMAGMFIGEAMHIIICMILLSFLGGILMGWSFAESMRLIMNSGLEVKLIVPWLTILKGIGFAFVTCTLMVALCLRKIIK